MVNYYQGSVEQPFHLSVGAALLNDKHEVACHHFKDFRGYQDFYILMRETLERNETIEQCLSRGLLEEFGATGEIQSFAGSIQSEFVRDNANIQKTTLYFLVKLTGIDVSSARKVDAEEKASELQWVPIELLIRRMKEQATRIARQSNETDLDESPILERVRSLLQISQ